MLMKNIARAAAPDEPEAGGYRVPIGPSSSMEDKIIARGY